MMILQAKAIEDFLAEEHPELPDIKGMPSEEIYSLIHELTGHPFTPKTEPYSHQLECTLTTLAAEKILLFLKPRLGKTKISLDCIEHWKKCGALKKKTLVAIPSPIIAGVWVSEARAHTNLSASILSTDLDELDQKLHDDTIDILIGNWAVFQHLFSCAAAEKKRKTKRVNDPDLDVIRAASELLDVFVVDEIHTCKNKDSLRWGIATEIAKRVKYRIGLTGTPFGANQFDVWAQAYLIDEGKAFHSSYHFFETAFGVKVKNKWSKRGFSYVYNPEKDEIFKSRIRSISLSYQTIGTKFQVYRSKVQLTMEIDQARTYKQLVSDAVKFRSGEILEADVGATLFMRLRQVSGGWRMVKKKDSPATPLAFITSAKLLWLEDFLESASADVKMIVFHEYVYSGLLITNLLMRMKIPYAEINGRTKNRDVELNKFVLEDARVIVLNTRSAGTGIELAIADYICYYESPTSPILREQTEKRAQSSKRGDRPLLIDDLVCSPVEEKILRAIAEGKDFAERILYEDLAELFVHS